MVTMFLIKLDLIVLTLLILYLLWVTKKHESAIVDLLILHPELLEEEDDGGLD